MALAKSQNRQSALRSWVVAQFQHPTGIVGHIAGQIMAHRNANIERNNWTVSLLDLAPDNHVLEIGSGPGLSLKACAGKLATGQVTGIDHAETMIAQAQKRLAPELRAGTVKLVRGDFAEIDRLKTRFDRIFSVNVIQFLPNLETAFKVIFNRLATGGTVATTYQPRHKNPSKADAHAMASKISAAMNAAGFANIRIEELPLKPVCAVCVLGQRLL